MCALECIIFEKIDFQYFYLKKKVRFFYLQIPTTTYTGTHLVGNWGKVSKLRAALNYETDELCALEVSKTMPTRFILTGGGVGREGMTFPPLKRTVMLPACSPFLTL